MSTTFHKAEILLAALGEATGSELAFVEGGECVIERDDGREISMNVDEASDALMILAALMPAGEADREALFAWLLELNLNDDLLRGSVVGLDRGTDTIALRYCLPLDSASPEQLVGLLIDLFELIDRMSQAILEFIQTNDESVTARSRAAAERAAEDAMRGPPPGDLV